MKDTSPTVGLKVPAENDKTIGTLLEQVRELIQSARKTAATAINSLQVHTNFEIGRMIVEHEQHGAYRAEYGKLVLKALSERLFSEYGRGFSERNLEYMRKFYITWKDRLPPISQKPSAKLKGRRKTQTPSEESKFLPPNLSLETSRQNARISSAQFGAAFPLSWSHYVLLLGIKDHSEQSFYEIEALQNSWSLPELKRQVNSSLYERLALSRDRDGVQRLAMEGQLVDQPADILKEPYVLEFLGLDEKAKYSESDLEAAIIDKLEHFLLELGKGFLFEARQKRFTFDEDHFFVDLVFYNRLLRCYVLIDLKIGKLTHQDLGQMQMYVNYFDRYVKLPTEEPTIGIILCKKKKDALVELTLPKDAAIHAKEYQLYLPSKEDLKQRLMEWAKEEGEE